jgi:hypothetical protein
VRYEIRNSPKVLFWHDVWCGEIPLKTDKMAQFYGIFCFLAQFMIGRWKGLVDCLRCCILLKLELRERIKCVGFQCERNLFR